MNVNFYLPRNLRNENETFSEEELLRKSAVVVVLAEPGAGKTELLNSLSASLGVARVKASIFRHQTNGPNKAFLVLDALDEVAKLDPSGIDALIVKAQESGAEQVILASRSSEWEEARSRQIRECFGTEPFVVRLISLSEEEQRALFDNQFPGEAFHAFREEICRFDLDPLLGNPQFLKLFAEAYIESGRIFASKQGIFELAVRRLAQEANQTLVQKYNTSSGERIAWSSEVFAKLLLSGAEGVSVADTATDRHFPRLGSLVSGNKSIASILDTRLFKPTDDPNQHEPVHRIVAEYCAARYLTYRIENSIDPFSLSQCLAVIAPNSVVRDELRGLLGWMASIGGRTLQEASIALDPYAVLANGDPSQLLSSSKQKLLIGLQSAAKDNPFFRRADVWRTFSASGFFTPEIVHEVKPLLISRDENGHLRGLLLELLEGSPAIPHLANELRALMLDSSESFNIRMLTHRCLISIAEHDHLSDVTTLIAEASDDALAIATQTFREIGIHKLGRDALPKLLRKISDMYPGHRERREFDVESRYYAKRLVGTLELSVVEWLLNQLTADIRCTCGKKKAHECDCLNGISKIVGSLLDRYFELFTGPYDPARIWQWVGNLNFHNGISAEQSASVRVLQTDHDLRQGIQRLVLEGQTDPDVVWDIRFNSFEWQSHAGLHFQPEDHRAIVDLAFENDNPGLWSVFIAIHNDQREREKRGSDELRKHMREQANAKSDFLREWTRRNRAVKTMRQRNRIPKYWYERKRKRRERKIAELNNSSFINNRPIIERGQHWGWLRLFAERYLMNPERLSEYVDDPSLPERALRNCLPFIEPEIPSLSELARLQSASKSLVVETVLYAACLAIFRREGNLNSVSRKGLLALKTNVDTGYSAVESNERQVLEREIDRILFPSIDDVESFGRDYIEPQILDRSCKHPQASWLRYKPVFEPIRGKLAFDWLKRFPALKIGTLDTLFDLCTVHVDRKELECLIGLRCAEFLFFWPDETDDVELEDRRFFWFLRHFYFVDGGPDAIWQWIRQDRNSIFALEQRSGWMNRGEYGNWPRLTAAKVFSVLDAFIEHWPKVPLPSHWGTDSPKSETAYRFLTDVVWEIGKDSPHRSIPILDKIIADLRFADLLQELKSMRATVLRERALREFEAPTPEEIANLLDRGEVATVEGLRALLLEELSELQKTIDGGEFDTVKLFYDGGKRVDENTASMRIAERLQLRLSAANMAITIEHHLRSSNRCDITASKLINGTRKLLVIEVKGQWHSELFTAVSAQLYERYSIHPDAEQQGIYLVLWFGNGEKVAGSTNSSITSAETLREEVTERVIEDLRNLIDVFVLDVSTT